MVYFNLHQKHKTQFYEIFDFRVTFNLKDQLSQMSVTGSVLKSLRCLTPSMSRSISSTPSSTQSAAAATAAKTAESGAKKEKLEFNYKDALNLECRLTEEEVMVRDVFHDYCQVDRWSSCQFQEKNGFGVRSLNFIQV